MKKVLIIQNKFLHYRMSFYDELSKYIKLTVLHSGKQVLHKNENYSEIVVPSFKIGPFQWQKNIAVEINSGKYDTVIAMFDVRWLSTILWSLKFDKKIKWIWWGLDQGKSNLALQFKLLLTIRNNAIIFYHQSILDFFKARGVDPAKLFVANNTFHIANSKSFSNYPVKDIFINVGSLEERKQNDITIGVFKKILSATGFDLKLIFIGEGPARKHYEDIIGASGMQDSVILLGNINDPTILVNYYKRAIASVSFGQAGLAVLQSMAYGVPFVTKVNAISGSEIRNIQTGKNGYLCEDDPSDLETIMLRLVRESTYAKELGENAYIYYMNNCTIQIMVDGVLRALNYKKPIQ